MPGVYIVSITRSVSSLAGTLSRAPLLASAFDEWIEACPDLTLDGMTPARSQLMDRVAKFWIPDEVILYIGAASIKASNRVSTVSERVCAYYSTKIGKSSPHSGGYFLKLLSDLSALWVHYAPCVSPITAETAMLEYFAAHVSESSAAAFHDTTRPMPFGNLEITKRIRKQHGIGNARRKKRKKGKPFGNVGPITSPHSPWQHQSATSLSAKLYRTQRVTAKDREHGQIRIPATTKALFSTEKAKISVMLRGQQVLLRGEHSGKTSWDPRMGPPERSGIVRVPSTQLSALVDDNESLNVSVDDSGTYIIA